MSIAILDELTSISQTFDLEASLAFDVESFSTEVGGCGDKVESVIVILVE